MNETRHRLKFDYGGPCRIYQDADRTEEVVSEQTEFPANKETTVYLQRLKKSDDNPAMIRLSRELLQSIDLDAID